MINLIKGNKGKIIHFYLKGNTTRYSGVVYKINEDTKILEFHSYRERCYVDINEIILIGLSDDDIASHVVPNAFT